MTTTVGGSPVDERKHFAAWELLPAVAVVAVVVAIGVRAFTDARVADLTGYYSGADLGWVHGNPWPAVSWDMTPFVALALGPFTREFTVGQMAKLVTALNLMLALGLAGSAVLWARRRVSPLIAWGIVFALVAWFPFASTVWFKQFNLVALTGAVAGFGLIRRRPGWAAFLIGASIAFKPLALLLPIFLLLRRETRRVGLLAVGWAVGLIVAGLGYLAWRAHDLGAADPFEYLRKFNHVAASPSGGAVCATGNIAPTGTACQLVGSHDLSSTRAVVVIGLLLVALLVVGILRVRPARSAWVLAWACLLTPMVSTIEWSHYLVMAAPMLLLLAVALAEERARLEWWLALGGTWAATQAVWTPFDTAGDSYRRIVLVAAAQYLLVLVAMAWCGRLQQTKQVTTTLDAGA